MSQKFTRIIYRARFSMEFSCLGKMRGPENTLKRGLPQNAEHGRYVKIGIQDPGKGISDEDLPKYDPAHRNTLGQVRFLAGLFSNCGKITSAASQSGGFHWYA